MKHLKTLTIIAGLVGSFASQAEAGIALNLFGGASEAKAQVENDTTGEKKDYTLKGSDLGAVIAYKLPLLPIQFGAYVSSYTFKSDDMYQDDSGPFSSINMNKKGRINGLTYGPHLRAWLPLGWFQPYAEAGYLFGKQTEKVTMDGQTSSASYNVEFNDSYDTQGALMGLGLRFSPIPFFGVALGYEMNVGTRTLKSAKVKTSVTSNGSTEEESQDATLTDEDKKAKKFNTSAVRLGFTFGF